MISFTYNYIYLNCTNILNTLYLFSYIYIYEVFFFLCFSFIIWNLIINNTFRSKFIYFFYLLLLVGGWGLFYSYDGIIMLLLIAELLIILLFLLMYVTINFEVKQSTNNKIYYIFYVFLGSVSLLYLFGHYFFLFSLNVNTYIVNNNIYEQMLDIISADFFIFYFYFFIFFPEITIYIALLLGFFSIFFIFFYFVLKFKQQTFKLKLLNYSFVRKQQLIHQINYKTKIINFQN